MATLGSRFAAANAANNYKPTGTPNGKSWCLPSYDLLNILNNSINFGKINEGITTAKGTILGHVYYNGSNYYENIWSSSENSRNSVWGLNAGTIRSNEMIEYDKDFNYEFYVVRPVMAF